MNGLNFTVHLLLEVLAHCHNTWPLAGLDDFENSNLHSVVTTLRGPTAFKAKARAR